jgi:hypothetical protein
MQFEALRSEYAQLRKGGGRRAEPGSRFNVKLPVGE